MIQSLCWGKDLTARVHGKDKSGKLATAVLTYSGETVNDKLISAGLARVAKPVIVKNLARRMVDGSGLLKLAAKLKVAARKSRSGMWRYGNVGDDDDEEI